MDATYRSDLRELNELNFARFDAKLEQRVAQLDAKLEQRAAQLDATLEQGLAKLGAELRTELSAALAKLETTLTRRMFAFWVAQAATTAALVFGVMELVR